ncbi:hypothetical protein T190607A01A_11346 [Tenacibaculum sp. 190524A05c]|uniref:Uncharacterized protein n=1 Tax=Tenacibaculum platacis TaxID=3137852 RepID=A0ABM9NX13_9FLAO
MSYSSKNYKTNIYFYLRWFYSFLNFSITKKNITKSDVFKTNSKLIIIIYVDYIWFLKVLHT